MKAKRLYMDLRSYMDKKRIVSLMNAGYKRGPKKRFVQELILIENE